MPALTTVEYPSGTRRCRSPVDGDPPKVSPKPYDRPVPDDKKQPRRRHRKPLSARRITDEEQLRGFNSIPIREKPKEIRQEVNWRRFARFDAKLKANNELPVEEEGYDRRYDMPLLEERIELGRLIDLPRRVRTDKFPSIKENLGLDGRAVREKLDKYATPYVD